MNWTGPEPLRKFLVPIDSIKPDPDNARQHDEKNVAVVRSLLETHGQMQVLTTYGGEALTGNARLGVMREMGWTHVAAVDLSEHFPTKAQARAYAIADNRTGELGEWNSDRLGASLSKLPDWAKPMTGFSPAEWNVKQSADWAKTPATKESGEHTYKLTADQFFVLDKAVAKVRSKLEDPSIARGRALEIIAASFVHEHTEQA